MLFEFTSGHFATFLVIRELVEILLQVLTVKSFCDFLHDLGNWLHALCLYVAIDFAQGDLVVLGTAH